jgi:peptide-methionine (S)-S-oxide reductase
MLADDSGKENIATFAAGCFWGVEHIFNKYFPTELKTTVGYSNGKEEITNPSYGQVCNGETDFAEAVRIEFDPEKVTYAQLVGE